MVPIIASANFPSSGLEPRDPSGCPIFSSNHSQKVTSVPTARVKAVLDGDTERPMTGSRRTSGSFCKAF